MTKSSLKKNFAYNLINRVSGMLFPLVTFPYASRILEADGIGEINFLNSIISWIMLIFSIGIPVYGVREVARNRDDKNDLIIRSTELWWLQLSFSLLGYLVVLFAIMFSTRIYENRELFLILSTSIFFNALGCEWFYSGVEDFKYITIRSIVTRILYIILLYLLVKSRSDLVIYAWLTVLVNVGSNIFNFYRFNNLIKPFNIKFKDIKPFKHIIHTLKIFSMSISINLYSTLNIVILGFLSTSFAVGYFVGATRITTIAVGVIAAIQTTLLPRASYLIASNKYVEYERMLNKILNLTYILVPPIVFGLIVMSPIIIPIFCGDTYKPAVVTLMIIAPSLFFSVISGTLNVTVMIPFKMENKSTIACIIAGIVSILINFLLIPSLAQNGASIGLVAAEFTVFFILYYYSQKNLNIKIFQISYIKYIIGAFIMYGFCLLIKAQIVNDWIALGVVPLCGFMIYLSFLFLTKDRLTLDTFNVLKTKISLR
ncbi:MAG: flippase [Muribaculaceae bacterium]|nr:flippase [Muribaculaceae bacterium]